MSIRAKLALVLAVMVAASVGVTTILFRALYSRALDSAESEKTRLLVESVRQVLDESRLAKDPLMLLDYASYLRRDRPEVARVRVSLSGQWQEPQGMGALQEQVRIVLVEPTPPNNQGTLVLELSLSVRELERRKAAALRSLLPALTLAAGAVVLAGLVLSFGLAWTMTRRLLAVERGMRAIGEGQLQMRLPERGGDEISRLARGLNAMAASLGELERMKRDFVASVTHELRSPLGAIASYAKILSAEAGGLNEPQRRQLARISDNAARLGHFVTSLLDLARIERGSLDFRPASCAVDRVVADVSEFLAPRAVAEGKTLRCEVEVGLEPIRADAELVAQVATNLISNAIKFSSRGGQVLVSVRRARGGVECSVADEGRGFLPEDREQLFKPFARGRNARGEQGTGLGLALCKSIADLHGGSISVEPRPGRGSRVTLFLPAVSGNGHGPAATT